MPAEEVSDRKPRVVLPPRCFKRTEAQIAGHEDAHPTDGTEERRYLAEVDPENHQPSMELAGSDQQEDDGMDRIVVAGDNNLKGGVIPHHDTPKQGNPGISNQQDAKQFVKGSSGRRKAAETSKNPHHHGTTVSIPDSSNGPPYPMADSGKRHPRSGSNEPPDATRIPRFRTPQEGHYCQKNSLRVPTDKGTVASDEDTCV
jgi:hypothetical protein